MTAQPEPIPQPIPSPNPTPASPLATIRENAAALLAVIIALAFVTALVFAFTYVGRDPKFTHAKELIGIVNGLMGVVLGYYFQKSSSDTQIENANKTVVSATKEAVTATAEAARAKEALREVAAAAADPSGKGELLPPRLERALSRADAILKL